MAVVLFRRVTMRGISYVCTWIIYWCLEQHTQKKNQVRNTFKNQRASLYFTLRTRIVIMRSCSSAHLGLMTRIIYIMLVTLKPHPLGRDCVMIMLVDIRLRTRLINCVANIVHAS